MKLKEEITMSDFILEMKGITKEFPGVKALDNVNLSVKRGEVHALCGENGAGKSTLMKVLSGIYSHGTFEGEIIIDGERTRFENIFASQEAGISIVHQELALIPEMTIAENIFLSSKLMQGKFISWNQIYYEAQKWLDEVGLQIDPQTKINELSVGRQQLVEIVKALTKEVKILILDEPTSALTESDAEYLFEIITDLKKQGVTCIYISHKLDEVLNIADSVTILRDGETIDTQPIEEMSEERIVTRMVGREIEEFFPYEPRIHGEEVMSVENYSFTLQGSDNKLVTDISFSLKEGEILGFSGLMGAGRTELFVSLFGGYEGSRTGDVYLHNEPITINESSDAIRKGIAYLSEDRQRYGLIPEMNVIKNTTLASLNRVKSGSLLDANLELKRSEELSEKVNLKAPSLEALVSTLSGGNQQKVVLSKWLLTEPKVLILDEPTRGIDVGAKYEIYRIIIDLAKQGVGIIIVSSELPEVLSMSDRIIVMNEGKISGELHREEATQENIMKLATKRS